MILDLEQNKALLSIIKNIIKICVVTQRFALYTCHIISRLTTMTPTQTPKKHNLGTKVSEDVAKALRIEQARRTINGEHIALKDIHAEWLEEKAKEVLKTS